VTSTLELELCQCTDVFLWCTFLILCHQVTYKVLQLPSEFTRMSWVWRENPSQWKENSTIPQWMWREHLDNWRQTKPSYEVSSFNSSSNKSFTFGWVEGTVSSYTCEMNTMEGSEIQKCKQDLDKLPLISLDLRECVRSL
jgi:hypothetical protein